MSKKDVFILFTEFEYGYCSNLYGKSFHLVTGWNTKYHCMNYFLVFIIDNFIDKIITFNLLLFCFIKIYICETFYF